MLIYTDVNMEKLEPRASKLMFLGYQKGIKGYKLWGLKESNLGWDVTFVEMIMLNPKLQGHHEKNVKDYSTHKKIKLQVIVPK